MPAVLNIFARSPYIVEINESAQTSSKVELFIWNGTGSAPSTSTYTLSKNVPSTTNLKTTYDISPFIREYINFDDQLALYNTVELTDTSQWCNVRVKRYKNTGTLLDTTDYIAYDGYGYYGQGYNPVNSDFGLADNTTYYFWNNGTIPVASFRAYLQSPSLVSYINLTDNSSESFPSITTEGIYNIPIVKKLSHLVDGVKVSIQSPTGTTAKEFTFKPITECRYTPVIVDFVNKFGAWEKLWFFKASTNSIETSGNEYNLLNTSNNYDINLGNRKTFNVNGTESIKVNSGWVDDSFAETLQQLLLSERILVDGKPANMKTKSLEKQKQINTKMINYQMEFQFAYDIINKVI